MVDIRSPYGFGDRQKRKAAYALPSGAGKGTTGEKTSRGARKVDQGSKENGGGQDIWLFQRSPSTGRCPGRLLLAPQDRPEGRRVRLSYFTNGAPPRSHGWDVRAGRS